MLELVGTEPHEVSSDTLLKKVVPLPEQEARIQASKVASPPCASPEMATNASISTPEPVATANLGKLPPTNHVPEKETSQSLQDASKSSTSNITQDASEERLLPNIGDPVAEEKASSEFPESQIIGRGLHASASQEFTVTQDMSSRDPDARHGSSKDGGMKELQDCQSHSTGKEVDAGQGMYRDTMEQQVHQDIVEPVRKQATVGPQAHQDIIIHNDTLANSAENRNDSAQGGRKGDSEETNKGKNGLIVSQGTKSDIVLAPRTSDPSEAEHRGE